MKGYKSDNILYVFDATVGEIPYVAEDVTIIYVQEEYLSAWVAANSSYASIIKPYNFNIICVKTPVWYNHLDDDILLPTHSIIPGRGATDCVTISSEAALENETITVTPKYPTYTTTNINVSSVPVVEFTKVDEQNHTIHYVQWGSQYDYFAEAASQGTEYRVGDKWYDFANEQYVLHISDSQTFPAELGCDEWAPADPAELPEWLSHHEIPYYYTQYSQVNGYPVYAAYNEGSDSPDFHIYNPNDTVQAVYVLFKEMAHWTFTMPNEDIMVLASPDNHSITIEGDYAYALDYPNTGIEGERIEISIKPEVLAENPTIQNSIILSDSEVGENCWYYTMPDYDATLYAVQAYNVTVTGDEAAHVAVNPVKYSAGSDIWIFPTEGYTFNTSAQEGTILTVTTSDMALEYHSDYDAYLGNASQNVTLTVSEYVAPQYSITLEGTAAQYAFYQPNPASVGDTVLLMLQEGYTFDTASESKTVLTAAFSGVVATHEQLLDRYEFEMPSNDVTITLAEYVPA